MTPHLSRMLAVPFDEAVTRTVDSLKREGFGVITEIDVAATLKAKLGVAFPDYRILGACNPAMAFEALRLESRVGAMLPCNVVVHEHGGETQISAIDPERMLSIVDNDELAPVAADVKARLGAVVERAAG